MSMNWVIALVVILAAAIILVGVYNIPRGIWRGCGPVLEREEQTTQVRLTPTNQRKPRNEDSEAQLLPKHGNVLAQSKTEINLEQENLRENFPIPSLTDKISLLTLLPYDKLEITSQLPAPSRLPTPVAVHSF